MILDTSATDADVLNVYASQDVTTEATVTGIETVNFILDALSSGGAAVAAVTQFDVAATNIAKGTKLTFDNVATTTIVNKLAVTGDKGGAREVSADFSDVATNAAAAVSYDLKATGTIGAPTKFTASANAKEVTLTAAGYLDVNAGSVDTLVNATSTKDMTITDAGDAAAVIANSGGKLAVTDAAKATVARLESVGDITVATSGLAAALAPIFVSGGTVTTPLTAATHVDVTAVKTATITETGTALVSANLTGRGEKTTFDFKGAGNKLANVTVNGDQDIVLNLSAANVENLTNNVINITDASTGTLTVKLSTTAGDVDLSNQSIDVVDLGIQNGGKSVTVASGQAVNLSVTQGAANSTSTVTAAAATASTNTLAITLNDGVKSATTSSVGLTDFAVSNFASVTIDASIDALQSGAAETHAITKFATNGANATITAGANKLTLGGAVTLGSTATLAITGSGTITGDASAAVTAKVFDASAATGVVTLATIESEEVGTVKTGSGNDVLTTTASAANAEKDLTINTGAGNDKLSLHAEGLENESLTIDMGDGTDTLVFAASQALTRTATDLNPVVGVENLEFGGNFTVDSSVISNQTWNIKATASATDTLTVTALTTDTAIDLSGLTVTSANAAEVADETFVVNVSGAGLEGVASIKGALIAKNTLTANALTATTLVGGAKADALNGADKADTITGGEGADVISGGKGNDTIILTESTAAIDKVTLIATADNGKDTIKGFGLTKDLVNLEGGETGNDNIAATATLAAVNVALTAGAAAYDISTPVDGTQDHIAVIGTALSSYGDLDAATDGSELLKALSSTSSAATQITTDSAAKQYLAFYQDGNAYIYGTDAGALDTAITASEITLVAVLEGVGTGTLIAANFAVV